MKRLVTSLVCVVILLALMPSAFINASRAAPSLDFFHSGSEFNKTLTGAELAELYLDKTGASLEDGEADFLDSFSSVSLTYSYLVPSDRIALEYDGANSTLTVRAQEYSYDADGGKFVWRPSSVEFMGSEYSFSGDDYELTVDSVTQEQSSSEVKVNYESEVTISENDVYSLINLYYDTAKYAHELSEYDLLRSAYESYRNELRIYEDKEARYLDYLDDLAEYERTLYRYENYNQAIKEYEIEYNKYLNYLTALYKYQLEYNEYLKYKNKVDKITEQLLPMELLKVPMADGRDVYSVIFGSTVDSVVENKELITGSLIGVDEEVVDLADESVARVRAHIQAYFERMTAKERYAYYSMNYESLCQDFRNLTASLDKLYKNNRVRGILIAEGKSRKYCILVAQLALITDALVDAEVYDLDGNSAYSPEWKIEGMTRDEILGGTYITDTDSAKPITEGFPPYYEVPTPPAEVAEPIRPQRPTKPVAPTEPEKPGAVPRPIVNPTPPVADAAVTDAYSRLSETKRAELCDKYASGELSPRSASELTLTLVTSVTDSYGSERVSVTFMSESGDSELCSATVRKGSAVLYEGELPQKSPDENYNYEFCGWVDADGQRVSLSSVSDDVTLYPDFQETKRIYSVLWQLGDVTVTTYHEAGKMPECPVTPTKADEGDFFYTFSGFDRELVAVTESTAYTAVFDKSYIVPTQSGGGAITESGGEVLLDLFGSNDTRYDIGALIERIAGKYSLCVLTTDSKIIFTYTDLIKMKAACVRYLSVLVVRRGEGAYGYRLSLLSERGEDVGLDLEASVSLPADFDCYDGALLYRESATSEREYVRCQIGDSLCSFTAKMNTDYTLVSEYGLFPYSTQGVTLSLDAKSASPGDRVKIDVCAKDGYALSELTVRDASGNTVTIGDDGYIIMPYSDVTVTAVAAPLYYTVSFVVNGKAIEAQRVRYAQLPIPPTVGSRSDSRYEYTFIRWSEEILPATSDKSYVAVFSASELSDSPETDNPTDSGDASAIIAAVLVTLTLASVVAVSVFIFVKRGKR